MPLIAAFKMHSGSSAVPRSTTTAETIYPALKYSLHLRELATVLRPGFETSGWAYSGGQL